MPGNTLPLTFSNHVTEHGQRCVWHRRHGYYDSTQRRSIGERAANGDRGERWKPESTTALVISGLEKA